ncbi:MAG TPA: Holliday junction resolvase RuvX [Bacteroidales bacterium]|nr:Holliday junction resolvase RuvX [Bacteroidales bacterium]HPM12402.1 Holliday junction resolvase RuvX [Bacteroidales bacterium]
MARILALDYGTKRTGIAVTDVLQLIATSLTTVRSHELLAFLETYFAKEPVELVVLGKPKTLRNEPSDNAKYVDIFEKQFRTKFPTMPIAYADERFTSSMALQTMIDGGVKKIKRQNKEMIDTISATIILQSYLEQKNNTL